MHGLYTWNATANIVLREFASGDPARLKEFHARFAAPVKPGVPLVVKMWKEAGSERGGLDEVFFTTETEGSVVLSNGRALISRT